MKSRFIAKRYWKDDATVFSNLDDALAVASDDLINLSIGDPDLTTNPLIIEQAMKDAFAGHTKYTHARGDRELRDAIADFYREEYGMAVRDEEIFVTAGALHAMHLVLEAILDDGDEVIVQAPYFTPYLQQVTLSRGIPVELPSYEEDGFQIDFDRLESLTNARTRAFILNTPCNPTGCVISEENMRRLVAYAERHGILIIADDIYTALSFTAPFRPIASLDDTRDHVVTLNSFSKNFTMTGWRLGCVIAHPDLIRTVHQINENIVYSAPSVSQRAGICALRNRREILPPLVEEYRRRVDYAARRMNALPNMSVLYPPQGTFYLFPNIKKTGLSSLEVSRRMLKEARVLALPGSGFGACAEGYLRVCCTVDLERLQAAFDRLEKMDIFSAL